MNEEEILKRRVRSAKKNARYFLTTNGDSPSKKAQKADYIGKKFGIDSKYWTPKLLKNYRNSLGMSCNQIGYSLGYKSGSSISKLEDVSRDSIGMEQVVDRIFYVHFQGKNPKTFDKEMERRRKAYLKHIGKRLIW